MTDKPNKDYDPVRRESDCTGPSIGDPIPGYVVQPPVQANYQNQPVPVQNIRYPQPQNYQPNQMIGMMPVPRSEERKQEVQNFIQPQMVGPSSVYGCKYPVMITCPSCHEKAHTRIEKQISVLQWVIGGILLFIAFPCCFIPCLFNDCYTFVHFCPKCN